MRSSIDRPTAAKARSRRLADTCGTWNRKLHYYVGLYFLFFLWLFTFTGLLLNHSSWTFAEFWPNRKVSAFERQIQRPSSPRDLEQADLEQARDIMHQLGIAGEIEWITARADSARLEFRANRPGHNFDIKADLEQARATVSVTEMNAWGIMRVLHTFTGVRAGDSRNQRDWIPTTVWALSMDAVAAGMVFMVCSGLYMWYGLTTKRAAGLAALGLGTAICGLFVCGLRWIW
jgi:hypothetical protein